MSGARRATILVLTLALAAFTFGCSDDGGGAAGSGGTAGGGGAAGGGGTAGGGGIGGEIAANFETSLHNTRAGQSFWYAAENGGIENVIGVAYAEFTCQGCHAPPPEGEEDTWMEPSCADCHFETGMGGAGGMPLASHLDSATCLGCHGRQARENAVVGMDFHTLAGFQCAACHGDRTDDEVVDAPDVHGDGTAYTSLLRPGAISARCDDCHTGDNAPDPSIPFHAPFGGDSHANLDCALCHTETVISCINCHLEEELDNEQKCASTVISNWKFVMKWDKEGDGNEVFHPATMMTVKYNCDRDADPGDCPDAAGDPKKTFAVIAPYYAHTVTQAAMDNILNAPPALGTDGCGYCHGTANCETILAAGPDNKQKLVEFIETGAGGAAGTGRLSNPISGLIPLPPDYQDRFEVDFVEYAKGPGLGCEPGPEAVNVFFETGPDLWQTGADFPQSANPRELGAPLAQDEFEIFCPPSP